MTAVLARPRLACLALALAPGGLAACVAVPAAEPLQFAVDADALPEARGLERELEASAEALRQDPELHLLIIGHADEDNTDEYNRALSQRRAEHVRERLAARLPSEARERLHLEARGEWDASDRAEPSSDEDAKARNRRVELRFFYPRQCEPSFDAAFLACEWARLPAPAEPEPRAPQPEPQPDIESEPDPRPAPTPAPKFRGPFVFGQVGYAIGSAEFLRQQVRYGGGAGYIWGFGSDFRVAAGLSIDHLVDLGFVFPQPDSCAPFCSRIDRSRVRVVPELRLGGARGNVWGWLRLSAGLLLQHRESEQQLDVDAFTGEQTITTLSPETWQPAAVFGIGPGVAVALTQHLLLTFDATVAYSAGQGSFGGTGIYDAGVGLGWMF